MTPRGSGGHLEQRPFTNRELSEAAHLPLSLAGKVTYCLRKMGVLEVVGKRGNAQLHAESQDKGDRQ